MLNLEEDMSTTNRQNRLDALKIREAGRPLTQEERAKLEATFAELDAEEAMALKQLTEKYQEFIDGLLEKEIELETAVAQL